jgi:uncharacterized membrane protein YkgB
MQFSFYDAVGTIGVVTIIITYVLLQAGRLNSENVFYSGLNAAGASLVIFSLYFDFNFPAFIVEFFWLLISLYGVGRYLFARETH